MSDASAAIGVILILIGLGLFVAELVHPGIFLLIPGTVIFVSGVMYLLLPGFLTTTLFGPLIVVGAALVATVLSILYYRHVAPVHPPMVTMPETLVGAVGVVTSPVVPDTIRGKVRIRSEIWSARSHAPIAVGTRVRVIGGEGVSLDVTPIAESGSQST